MDKNGWTKNGEISGDYLRAGRDPDLPRPTMQDITERLEDLATKCGDIVEVLWPGKGRGYHAVLGHSSDNNVILAIKNDREDRNTVIPASQIERILCRE